MSAEENKALVRRYFDPLSEKDKSATTAEEYVADEGLKQHVEFFEAAFTLPP